MAMPTELVLMRHLHKAQGQDPALSVCGQAQVAAVKQLLQHLQFTKGWHSQFKRTEHTAKAILGAAVSTQHYDAKLAAQDAIQLLQAEQGVQLWVGHSNTIPALLHTLAGVDVQIGENDYGTLYHLRWRKGQWQLQQLHITQPPQCTVSSTASQ